LNGVKTFETNERFDELFDMTLRQDASLMKLLLIACGGALGSVFRYIVTVVAVRIFGHAFPMGTLAVNLIGCFLIGVLAALFNRQVLPHDQYRLAITVGFLAFGMFERGHLGLAALNIGANVIGGLLAIWLGVWLLGICLPTQPTQL
jgi:CrcB protein